jgi:hypothetical protein
MWTVHYVSMLPLVLVVPALGCYATHTHASSLLIITYITMIYLIEQVLLSVKRMLAGK